MTEKLVTNSSTDAEYKEQIKCGLCNGVKDNKHYCSRTKLGLCKNEGCKNKRRIASAFCQECSDKHK